MFYDDELDSLRDAAEQVMTDTCVITRATAQSFDADTGTLTPTTTIIYSGKCQLRVAGNLSNETLFGGESVSIRRFLVAVPHDVDGVQLDDRIVVTGAWDDSAAGRDLRVVSVPSRTINLSRALGCEVVE